MRIRKVGVLGAGVMGSGIAAHLANAGIDVELLDVKPEWSAGALEKALKQKPAPFMDNAFAARVRTGGFDADMARLTGCDWVVEVVTEDLAIKEALYAKVLPHLSPTAIFTSNTSGIPLAKLTASFPEDVQRRFFITHFFNPPRYMRLLEVVAGPRTDAGLYAAFKDFAARRLGKGVVDAKDTVNFIANRIGVHGMMVNLWSAIEGGYTVAEVDAITGPATGRPSSACFGTADLVGLDTLAHVANNCYENLPRDEDRDIFKLPPVLTTLIERKAIGRKAGAGFFKKVGPDLQTLDFATMEYRVEGKVAIDSIKIAKNTDDVAKRVAGVLAAQDRAGDFARKTMLRSFAYAARRVGEIADDVKAIDDAMKWGFAWDMGPFELWQGIGVSKVNELMASTGIAVPEIAKEAAKKGSFYDASSTSPIQRAKAAERTLAKSFGAHLVDLGDGVLAFEIHTKMNALDDDVVGSLQKAIDLLDARDDLRGMVLANDASSFSVGANLMLIMMGIQQKNWAQIDAMAKRFQDTFQSMKRVGKPIVAAPHAMALGGGCEICLGADRVRANSELYMGLVEVGVGLIPGAGGTLELLKRVLENVPVEKDLTIDRLPHIVRAFLAIGMGKVSTSAHEARRLGFLRPTDNITFDRERLVADAKADVLHMSETGYSSPLPADYLILPGKDGAAAIGAMLYAMETAGQVSAHDRKIGNKLARVLTGGDANGRDPVSEQTILDLEREAFLSLCGEELTLARIQHMLKTGKPLRN